MTGQPVRSTPFVFYFFCVWKQSSKIKSPLTASNVVAMLPYNTWTAQQFQLNSSVLPFVIFFSFGRQVYQNQLSPNCIWFWCYASSWHMDCTAVARGILPVLQAQSFEVVPTLIQLQAGFFFLNYLFPFRIICGLKDFSIISLTVSY